MTDDHARLREELLAVADRVTTTLLDSQMMAEAAALIKEMAEALKPFAHESTRWTDATPDQTPLVGERITEEGWEYRFTVGDLRRAQDAIREHIKGGDR